MNLWHRAMSFIASVGYPVGLLIVICVTGCTPSVHERTTGDIMLPSVTLSGHDGYVTSLCFLDRNSLATASFDKTVLVWEVTSGKVLCKLAEHREQIGSLVASADGEMLISRAQFEGIICWSRDATKTHQYRLQRRIQVWPHVTAMALSNDKKMLVVGEGYRHPCVQLYSIQDSKYQTILRTNSSMESIAFSPDNRFLVVTTGDSSVVLYDMIHKKSVFSIHGQNGGEGEGVFCCTFSPDGKTITTGGIDQCVRVWERNTGKELLSLTGHRQIVKSVSVSPDGRLLASAGGEGYDEPGELFIWDLGSQKKLVGFCAHTKPIRCVAFSPDGRLLATGSEDTTVKIWELRRLLEKKKTP